MDGAEGGKVNKYRHCGLVRFPSLYRLNKFLTEYLQGKWDAPAARTKRPRFVPALARSGDCPEITYLCAASTEFRLCAPAIRKPRLFFPVHLTRKPAGAKPLPIQTVVRWMVSFPITRKGFYMRAPLHPNAGHSQLLRPFS